MKTLIAVTALFLFTHSFTFSQNNLPANKLQEDVDYFSWSYELGFGATTKSRILNDKSLYGQTGGIEVSFHDKGSNEFFISGSYRKLTDGSYYNSPSISQISIGPRVHLFKKINLFAEGAFALFILNGSGYYYNDSKGLINDDMFIWYLLGFGKEFAISKSATLALSAKFSTIFNHPGMTLLYGISSRVTFNNKYTEVKKTGKDFVAHWAFTLLGGMNNPDYFANKYYDWGGSYGVEAAYRHSERLEATITVMNSQFVYHYQDYYYEGFYTAVPIKHYVLGINLGERFFFNHDAVSSFISIGAAIHGSYYSISKYNYNHGSTDPNLGFSIGTGLIVHAYKQLSINISSNCNILVSGSGSDVPWYLTVTSGIRYDL